MSIKKLWVFTCDDICPGLMSSMDKKKVEFFRKLHKKKTGHDGTVTLMDRELVESL